MQAYRRNMSTPNFQGNPHLPDPNFYSSELAHTRSSEHDAELFGLSTGAMGPMTFDELLGQETSGALSPEAPAGTISPKDLMFDASVPPSGTFTDLSTPPFDSPGTFSQNPSPLFTDVDFAGDEWPSLFQDGSAMNPTATGLFDVDTSFNVVNAALAEPKKEVQPSIEMSPAPKRLSVKASPISATGAHKPSAVSGITRQRKELSPIEFDPNDPIAAKRARNTEAARKSRAKKLARQSCAETRIKELEAKLAQRDELIANLQAQLDLHKSLQ